MKRLGWYVAAALVVYLLIARAVDDAKDRKLQAAYEKKFQEQAIELQFIQARKLEQRQLIASLEGRLAETVKKLQTKEPTTRVASHAQSTVSVADIVPGSFRPQPVAAQDTARPSGSWDDEYHRFHLALPNGPLTRTQLFKFDGVIVKRLGGKYEFYKGEFREYDPVTKKEIPVTGVSTASTLEVMEEEKPPVGAFHPIVVAAADPAGVGAGVEFFRYKQLSLSALGLYDKSAGTVRGAVQLGWRLRFPFLDTNASVGVSYSTDQRLRPGATLQITR